MYKYTGIDISKATFDCSITTENGNVETKKMSNNLKGFEKLKSSYANSKFEKAGSNNYGFDVF